MKALLYVRSWVVFGAISITFLFAVVAIGIIGHREIGIMLGWRKLPPISHEHKAVFKSAAYMEPTYAPDPLPLPASNGAVQAVLKISTNQPVVFVGIDDGVFKDEAGLEFMIKHHIHASLFLNDLAIANNYTYFKRLQEAGSTIQNHTVSHPMLTTLPYDKQKHEICEDANRFARVFGVRPTLFRPPYGAYNQETRKAAYDCGMKALVNWSVDLRDGKLYYQSGDHLRPGDIVLMHFHPNMTRDLQALQDELIKRGLTTAKLEDWIH